VHEPVTLAAIDAGSNAIRIVVAEAHGPGELVVLSRERAPVRLGRRAFTRRNFDKRPSTSRRRSSSTSAW
jgi:exopolyphosphatase/pppGpp-phosphohydrolase